MVIPIAIYMLLIYNGINTIYIYMVAYTNII